MAEKEPDPQTTPGFAARVVGQMLAAAELCFTQHNDATEAMKYTQAALNAANAFAAMQQAITKAKMVYFPEDQAVATGKLPDTLHAWIARCQDTLDTKMVTSRDTTHIAGQIAAYKHVLSVIDPSLAEKRSAALDLKI